MKKISIIGAGNVGTATARSLAIKELSNEIALIDTRSGVAEGNALDIQEAAPLLKFNTRVTGHSDLHAIDKSDLIIITAGHPRKPGMSRSDVLGVNIPIIYDIAASIRHQAPEALILVVTNPIDSLTYLLWKKLQCNRQKIIGLGGVLDTSRMASFIALETGLSTHDISTLVLGGHGDSMLPMPRFSTVNGIPIEYLLDQQTIEKIVERTRFAGAEILEQRKFSAYETPAAAIETMVSSIIRNHKQILPCVAILDGEYGQKNIAMSVPVQLGKNGMERIIELPLLEAELALLKKSAAAITHDLENVSSLLE